MLRLYTAEEGKLTPGLDIHGDDGLGSDLGLGSLLLAVGSKALLTDAGSLSVLFLIVRAEKVDILLLLLASSLRGLGGVDGDLGDIRAVGGVGGRRVAGEGGELILVGGDVLVPAGSVGVLLGGGSLLQGLEDGNISLGGSVAIQSCALARACSPRTRACIDVYSVCCWRRFESEVHKSAVVLIICRVLSCSATRTSVFIIRKGRKVTIISWRSP